VTYRDGRLGLPLLGNTELHCASPCAARGDAPLIGSGRERYCWRCGRDVYDIASLSPQDARAVLGLGGAAPPPRLYVRDDGSVMTADCPVGMRRRRVRRWLAASMWAFILAAPLALAWPPQLREGPTDADFTAALGASGAHVNRIGHPFCAFRGPAAPHVQRYAQVVAAGPAGPPPPADGPRSTPFYADRP
jgi:hypothetical protein